MEEYFPKQIFIWRNKQYDRPKLVILAKENIENRINLSQVAGNEKRVLLTGNKIMRICLIAGLNVAEKRSMEHIKQHPAFSKSSIRIPSSFFTHNNQVFALLPCSKTDTGIFKIDWNDNPTTVSRIIAAEMFRFYSISKA